MSKSIFISCVFEDSIQIKIISKWADDGLLGKVVITSEVEDKRPLGYDAIRAHIRPKIEGAAIILVLIGTDTHNHDWIKAEVELANSFHKKIICARIKNSTGGIPPILKNFKVINLDSVSLRNEIAIIV